VLAVKFFHYRCRLSADFKAKAAAGSDATKQAKLHPGTRLYSRRFLLQECHHSNTPKPKKETKQIEANRSKPKQAEATKKCSDRF
jgi:hypothetical protein